MADAIIPNLIRAQVVFQGNSNLPEDRFVNNFHFRVDGPINEASFDGVADLLVNFYNTPRSYGGSFATAIAAHLHPAVNRGTDTAEVRMYDLGESHPRTPHVRKWNPAAPGSQIPVPHEVAVVATYYGDRNIPRERGRLFFGPLCDIALNRPTGGIVTVDDNFRGRLAIAMSALAGAQPPTLGTQWVVVSQSARDNSNTAIPYNDRPKLPSRITDVTKGWIDNALDTQRRRGIKASGRMLWAR